MLSVDNEKAGALADQADSAGWRGNWLLAFGALVLLAGQLVGGLSLARLGIDIDAAGVLSEARLTLVWLAFCVGLFLWVATPQNHFISFFTRLWVFGVTALHALVMSSWIWSVQSSFSAYQIYELSLMVLTILSGTLIFTSAPRVVLRLWMLGYLLAAFAFIMMGMLMGGSITGDLSSIGAGGIGGARLLSAGILILMFQFFRTGTIAWLLPVPLLLLGVLSSGSRAAALGLFCGILIIWLKRRKIRRDERRMGGLPILKLATLTVLLSAAVLVIPAGRKIVVDFLVSNLVFGGDAVRAPGIYLADRDVIFQNAWNHFMDNVFTGSGLGTYAGPFGELYPHNLVLNFAVDGGVVSLMLAVVMLATGLLRILRCNVPAALLCGALAVFFVVGSLFAGTYYDARSGWLFLLIGLLCIDEWSWRETGRGRL